MTSSSANEACPPQALEAAVKVAAQDTRQGLAEADRLLGLYPGDARLHFLRGSLLADGRDYAGARDAMQRAVELAPTFTIGRFQLGLLQLSSGDAAAAEATWQPLDALPQEDALRLLASGLRKMIHDDFADASRLIREGMARNHDNPALNSDMQLILNAMQEKGGAGPTNSELTSATQLLLQQFASRTTKH